MKNMNSGNRNFTRSVLSLAVIFVLASVSFAQIKLRNALDYDGDSKADLAVWRNSDNNWYVLKSNGSGYLAQNFGVSHTDTLTPGDFDGDGKGDFAVWRYSNGTFYWLESSTGTFRTKQWGIISDEPVCRDFDGDGKTDVAVVRRTNGAMIWYISRSSDSAFIATQFGLTADFAVPGDYDGDGKFDIAIYRPGATATAQATYWILQSQTSTIRVANWGLGSDVVIPGDYDGDNKTDLAVMRRSSTPAGNLNWYILKSSDSGFQGYTFGTTEFDSPVQNDYDGDGKTDIAVWRETDGNFYILQSQTGVAKITNWGFSTDSPIAAYDMH